MTREELNQEKQKEIIDEEKREKRKKIIIFSFKCVVVFITCFLLFYCYTTYVSSAMMIVKEERIINEKLPSDFTGLKVIHFSDLHYGTTMFEDGLKKIVKEINSRSPDLVVFTGDLIDEAYDASTEEMEMISKYLMKIDASLGKYAVSGEEDNDNFTTIMNQSNFIVLDNDYDLIYKNSNTPILLVGLDSKLSGEQNIEEGFAYFKTEGYNSNIYTIVLAHEPDSVVSFQNMYSSDLVLAGHSHNGNIRIPFIGAIEKVEGAKKYDQEHYSIGKTELYISSGLGTNGPGFRLFCRPSINFFRLSSE